LGNYRQSTAIASTEKPMTEATLVVVLMVIVPLLSGAISYGVTKGTLNGLKERIKILEANRFIARDEYEARHSETVAIVKAALEGRN
jgi:hypothetical protein